jgi:hypothetical protein
MRVTRFSPLILTFMLIVAAGLACGFPSMMSEVEQEEAAVVATRVAKTVAARGVAGISEEEGVVQPPHAASQTDSAPPTITHTPTVTHTPTSSAPMVSVSVNTNCRYGPGMAYEYLGALLEGEVSRIHGRNQYDNFWYIENPDQPGGYCWVSGAYAQVTGDTSQLPVLTPPPTPTHTPVPLDFNFVEAHHLACGADQYIEFTVRNTGQQTFRSFTLNVEDLDTSDVKPFVGNCFNVVPGCVIGFSHSVDPGGQAFIKVGIYAYNPSGNQVRTTAKMCSEEMQGGNCVEKTFTHIVTASPSSISDVALKENRDPVDAQDVLEHLLTVPIETWNYIADPDAIRHMGPMAQDFFSAYGLGVDDRLNAIDVQGVALAAIQALHEDVQEKEAQLVELEARLSALEEQASAEDPSTERIGLLVAGFLAGAAVTLVAGWARKRSWRMKSQ